MAEAKLYCGTSGFAYESWKGGFYPEALSSSKFLSYYATRLNAVEVNYTYRRLASAATFQKWMEATPPDFLFLPKAHMKITHSLKLKDAEEFTRVFLDSLAPLQEANRLGPILFQLPPSLKSDPDLLADFAGKLPRNMRAAFEFRNASWFNENAYRVMRDANVALCLAENESLETPYVITADFVYLRLRKPDYSDSEMSSTAHRIEQYLANAYPTYAIFKHEESPSGALNAEKILVGQKNRAPSLT